MTQLLKRSALARASLLALALAGTFAVGFLVAAQPLAPAVKPGREGKTVWVDISALNRKNGAADKMTKLHQEMAKQGFTCIGVAVYQENGDLEGFYCTYVKEP